MLYEILTRSSEHARYLLYKVYLDVNMLDENGRNK